MTCVPVVGWPCLCFSAAFREMFEAHFLMHCDLQVSSFTALLCGAVRCFSNGGFILRHTTSVLLKKHFEVPSLQCF